MFMYEKRCADCAYLIEKHGLWYCDDLCDFCENIEWNDGDDGAVYVMQGGEIIDVFYSIDDYRQV